MRWFKHLCISRMDPKIAALQDALGALEGYGFYFKMLEIVGEQVDETGRCHAQYSAKTWSRLVCISATRWLRCSQVAAKLQLWSCEQVGNDWKVEIPNLLKYRDNHTSNKQATCKRLTKKGPLIRTDKETDTDTEQAQPQAAAEIDTPQQKKQKRKNNPSPEFEADWMVIRTVRGEVNPRCSKAESWRRYSEALAAGVRRETIIAWWKRQWEVASADPQYWPTFQVKAKALDLLDWQNTQAESEPQGANGKTYSQDQLAAVMAKTQKGGAT